MIGYNWQSFMYIANRSNKDINMNSFQSCRDLSDGFRDKWSITLIQDVIFSVYLLNEICFSIIILKLFISRLINLMSTVGPIKKKKVRTD